MKRGISFFQIAVLAIALCTTIVVTRAEQEPQAGVAEGVLTAKGETWIAVQADGAREATKLVPCWVGGLPTQGGGLDKRMLLMFQQLVVGSRLKVAWMRGEHLCVTDIQVLKLPGQDDENNGQENHEGDGNANNGNANNGNAQHEEPPAQKAGKFAGVVTSKGENWIMIRPDGQRESQKFIPRWIGGTPDQGGGLDKDALRAIAAVKIGAHVNVTWVWNEHYRLTGMQPA